MTNVKYCKEKCDECTCGGGASGEKRGGGGEEGWEKCQRLWPRLVVSRKKKFKLSH